MNPIIKPGGITREAVRTAKGNPILAVFVAIAVVADFFTLPFAVLMLVGLGD